MPNFYVNNNGKPNLDRSNADNDNDGRFALGYEGIVWAKIDFYASRQFAGGPR